MRRRRISGLLLGICLLAGLALADRPLTAAPEGDWFLTEIAAGPAGAKSWRITYETTGKATGEHVAFGLVVSAGGQVAGDFVQGFGSGLIIGVNAGPVRVEEELVPVEPDAYSRTLVASGPELSPGQKAHVLSFASGTRARPSAVGTSVAQGSVSVGMTVGTGSKAILLFERSSGVAAEALSVGAGSSSHTVDSAGMVGGLLPCEACVASWLGPDGRRGDNSGDGSFAAPAGRWSLDWSGASNPGLGRPTVAAYAPVGAAWDRFRAFR